MNGHLGSHSILFKTLILIILGTIGVGSYHLLSQRFVSPDVLSSQYQPSQQDDLDLSQQWIVNPQQAVKLIQQGATLLDARPLKVLRLSTLPHAQPVAWQDFSQTNPSDRGKLISEDDILTQKLRQLGISQHQPVVVVGDPKMGWGEEGRIVWMLRTLGHDQAVWVDGGYLALIAKLQALNISTPPPKKGDFVVRRRFNGLITQDQLQQQRDNPNVVIIDSREPREYQGATPYGEKRGGHIPGAISLYYKDWLDENGLLLPQNQILTQLQQLGITPKTEVIVYCTGGIRSAWMTTVLTDLGYNAKNYAGSMWEWSADAGVDFPLIR